VNSGALRSGAGAARLGAVSSLLAGGWGDEARPVQRALLALGLVFEVGAFEVGVFGEVATDLLVVLEIHLELAGAEKGTDQNNTPRKTIWGNL